MKVFLRSGLLAALMNGHAKAQRRKGAKKSIPLRLCVKLFAGSICTSSPGLAWRSSFL